MTTITPDTTSLATLADALEKLMRALVDEHARLLQILHKKKEAVRHARIAAVTALCDEERRMLQRISEIERHRGELTRRAGAMLGVSAGEPVTISRIAEAIAEPESGKLKHTAAQLREAVLGVRHESSVVRAAAEALARHMSGIMQTVYSALSRAGVYGRKGHLAVGAQLESSVDVKS